MKLTTIVLATAFALSGTAALAQQTGTQAVPSGYGSVVAPSVGSYPWPSVGSTLSVPTWSNTFHSPPSPSGSTFAPTGPGFGSRR
jgi:hypothetical protein